MFENETRSTTAGASVLWVVILAAGAVACGGTPTEPLMTQQQPTLTTAMITVEGVVMNNQQMPMHEAVGSSTFFEAHLQGPDDHPLTGATVQVRVQRPWGMGPMMGQRPMTLWDDGTHGDPVAGDGVYCFEDLEGQFGFHMPHHQPGEYHYEFFGIDHHGHHSNHVEVMVTLTR